MERQGIIYCITCPTGKRYVGQTVRKLEKRLEEHCKNNDCCYIHQAILKYGIDNMAVEVLIQCPESHLDDHEEFFIKGLNTLHPLGYNIRTGGAKGGRHCEASKEKMRQSKLGEMNHNYGKPRDAATKLKISIAKTGEKHHFYGKTFSEEHKVKCAVAHRKNPEDKELPLYLVRIPPMPERYTIGGYAVCNHPMVRNKWFCSSKLSMEEKYMLAFDYLTEANKQKEFTD
jgi:group I intron endonuclease